jgi:hypothetical protein
MDKQLGLPDGEHVQEADLHAQGAFLSQFGHAHFLLAESKS